MQHEEQVFDARLVDAAHCHVECRVAVGVRDGSVDGRQVLRQTRRASSFGGQMQGRIAATVGCVRLGSGGVVDGLGYRLHNARRNGDM